MLFGYVEFVALLFLPGLAFMELFGVGADLSFAERLGLAFGLSMAVDVSSSPSGPVGSSSARS